MACCKKKDKIDCCSNDHLVCVCMGVMQSDVCQAIDDGHDTFDKLQQKLEVGTGCSSCVSEVNEILACKKKNL
ncbi:(2Fe-2S)-binding protein [Candidatus Babeliales bacterium]|nr:(2Fe-2S)-binding protein [Candidatus Babeliales bacterium]MBP9843641.1 (2Fe-2S)-binding protein [Candidatus Babeliales bacterium]